MAELSVSSHALLEVRLLPMCQKSKSENVHTSDFYHLILFSESHDLPGMPDSMEAILLAVLWLLSLLSFLNYFPSRQLESRMTKCLVSKW